MSDGPSDAHQEAIEARRIQAAAEELAASLEQVKDAVFGIKSDYLRMINEELRPLGLRIQERPR